MNFTTQSGGDNSTNLQAQTINLNSGLSYPEVRQIALDVFESKFISLRNEAAELARERAEEITEKFISTLSQKNPNAFSEFRNPAMQDAIFIAQKSYAKSGDKDLSELLVDILVDRACATDQTVLQIIFADALRVASSITARQMDVLTLCFVLNNILARPIESFESLKKEINSRVAPFTESVSLESDISYFHLEYQRCLYLRTQSKGDWGVSFYGRHKHIFPKAFYQHMLSADYGIDTTYFEDLLVQCDYSPHLLQFAARSLNEFVEQLNKINAPYSQKEKVKAAYTLTVMEPAEVRQFLLDVNSCMKIVYDVWSKSRISNAEISSLGVVVAIANLRRKTGIALDFSEWIREA